MQTTLEIDDDALELVRDEAERRHTTIDATVSTLIRDRLAKPAAYEISPVTGLPLLPRRPGGQTVTLELVKALMDEEDEKYFR